MDPSSLVCGWAFAKDVKWFVIIHEDMARDLIFFLILWSLGNFRVALC